MKVTLLNAPYDYVADIDAEELLLVKYAVGLALDEFDNALVKAHNNSNHDEIEALNERKLKYVAIKEAMDFNNIDM